MMSIPVFRIGEPDRLAALEHMYLVFVFLLDRLADTLPVKEVD